MYVLSFSIFPPKAGEANFGFGCLREVSKPLSWCLSRLNAMIVSGGGTNNNLVDAAVHFRGFCLALGPNGWAQGGCRTDKFRSVYTFDWVGYICLSADESPSRLLLVDDHILFWIYLNIYQVSFWLGAVDHTICPYMNVDIMIVRMSSCIGV